MAHLLDLDANRLLRWETPGTSRCELQGELAPWLLSPSLGAPTHSENIRGCRGGGPRPSLVQCSLTLLNHSEGSPGHLRSLLYVPQQLGNPGHSQCLTQACSPHGCSQRTVVATLGLAVLTGPSVPGQVRPPMDQGGPCEESWRGAEGLRGYQAARSWRWAQTEGPCSGPWNKSASAWAKGPVESLQNPWKCHERKKHLESALCPHRSWHPDPAVSKPRKVEKRPGKESGQHPCSFITGSQAPARAREGELMPKQVWSSTLIWNQPSKDHVGTACDSKCLWESHRCAKVVTRSRVLPALHRWGQSPERSGALRCMHPASSTCWVQVTTSPDPWAQQLALPLPPGIRWGARVCTPASAPTGWG